ncbi:hypothetical protein K438DRAFT_979770 [Mycena galopus ATCC 62051]|nr:hypothetical protein K438DRAFT_979770 [Mycena galopus ATCC 62051]
MRAAQESHLRPQRADGKGKFTEGDGKQPGVGRRPTTSSGDRPISAYPNGNGTAAPKLPAHLFPGLEPKPFPGAELRGDLKAAPGASGSHIRPNPSGSPLRAGAKSPTSSSGGRPLSVRPRSLSSGASSLGNQLGVIGQEWPARLSSNSTPWTSPATSWPAAGAVAPRDQVLKSAALVARILDLLDFPDPKYDERKRLKKQRRSLLHVALTCKSVSLPAIKVLWRRLDNILPLLRLLPSFGERGGKWVSAF